MAFCINCGSQVPDGAKFCAACGTPVASIPAPAPAPEPEPIPEPIVEPAPEPAPAPAPAPQAAPMHFEQVQPADTDPDLDMEGPPIVGSYAIPGMENVPQQQYTPPVAQPQEAQAEKKYTGYPPGYVEPAQQAATAQQQASPAKPAKAQKPPKAPKQPSEGGNKKLGFIMLIIIGALSAIAIIIGIISMITGAGSTSSKKKGGAGEGTALTELLDNAAATYYNGGGASSSDEDDFWDEDDDTDADDSDTEDSDEEETSDAADGSEQLFQGCIYATLPAGFVQGGSDGTSEEEFYREDDKDCKIKLHVSSGKSAKEAAKEDVNWWIENKGEDCGYSIADDVKAGNYTWTVEHYPFNGENSSAKFFADVDDKNYLEVVCFMMNETDPDVISFLESIHMEDGDPGKLRSAWLDSRNK